MTSWREDPLPAKVCSTARRVNNKSAGDVGSSFHGHDGLLAVDRFTIIFGTLRFVVTVVLERACLSHDELSSPDPDCG
jgi:hypothetical protein